VVVVGAMARVKWRAELDTQLTDLSPQTSANVPNRLTQTVLAERTGLNSDLRKVWLKM
jgi:hypothetical protein